MLLHGFVENSSVNGPGERCVVWFQGCVGMGGRDKHGNPQGCSGCWNPDSHAFDESKKIPIYEFIDNILAKVPENISGITFSGGDPMQHYMDTFRIAKWVRAKRPNWTIGMFTGYTEKELESGKWEYYAGYSQNETRKHMIPGDGQYWERLKVLLDYGIMGRYNQLAPSNTPLVTSSNQKLTLFSDAYTETDFPPQAVEVIIDDSGMINITGFPIGVNLSEFKNETRERQIAG